MNEKEEETKFPIPGNIEESHRTSYRVQLWIIGYLASKDINEPESEGRASTNAWILSKSLPWDLISDVPTEDDLIYTLQKMEENNWLRKLSSNYQSDRDDYCLTSSGMLKFRAHLRPIANILNDKKNYESVVERTDGAPDVKATFRDKSKDLIGKWRDDAIDFLISTAKEVGPRAVIFLIDMAMPHNGAPIH